MNYGLYLSASGMLTSEYRQNILANNLANVDTAAFKPDVPAVVHRGAEAIENQLGGRVAQQLLDQLGGGALANPATTNFAPGPLKHTGNPLDVALDQPNAFFAVRVHDAQTGKVRIELTRDGRFTRNAMGQLVTPDGSAVLDVGDQPIVITGSAPVRIDPAGRVLQNGEMLARLQVASVRDPQALIKQGDNRFAFTGRDPRTVLDNPTVRPGFVEGSGVNPITTLMKLIRATHAMSRNATMIHYADLTMNKAVNQLGSVG